jgi:hypothetical protein
VGFQTSPVKKYAKSFMGEPCACSAVSARGEESLKSNCPFQLTVKTPTGCQRPRGTLGFRQPSLARGVTVKNGDIRSFTPGQPTQRTKKSCQDRLFGCLSVKNVQMYVPDPLPSSAPRLVRFQVAQVVLDRDKRGKPWQGH